MVLEMVKGIAHALADETGTVTVRQTQSDSMTVIEVHASRDDVGKIIGKSGQTADAIRLLINCVGARERRRYILQIVG